MHTHTPVDWQTLAAGVLGRWSDKFIAVKLAILASIDDKLSRSSSSCKTYQTLGAVFTFTVCTPFTRNIISLKTLHFTGRSKHVTVLRNRCVTRISEFGRENKNEQTAKKSQ